MIRTFFILFICVLISEGISANSGLSKSEWNKLIKNLDYTENYREFKQQSTETKRERQRNSPDLTVSSALLKILPIILLVGVLIFLIIMILNNPASLRTTRRVSKKTNVLEVDNPDEYEKTDLEKYLGEALSSGDYRLAIRIQFLLVIKALQENDLIRWRKEKTNIDYVFELTEKYRSEFSQIVNAFERIWYADYTINRDVYHILSPRFESIKMKIRK